MELRSGKVCSEEVVSKEPSTDKKVVDKTKMKTFEEQTSMFLKRVKNLYDNLCDDELLKNVNAFLNFYRYLKNNYYLVLREQNFRLNVTKRMDVIRKKSDMLSDHYANLLHTQDTDYYKLHGDYAHLLYTLDTNGYKNKNNIEEARVLMAWLDDFGLFPFKYGIPST